MPATPHHVDRHVGRRLRLRRQLLGLSLERLGERLGLTFQQIQKYERGTNRLGASRLYEAARALEVDVGFFFADMAAHDDVAAAAGERVEDAIVGSEGAPCPDVERGRDTFELVRAFERIADRELRQRVLELVKAVAAAGDAGGLGP